MAKYFIDLVQDSPRTCLGIPVKTKITPSLEPIHRPRNHLSALNFTGGWFQLKVAYDSSVIRSPGTFIRGHTRARRTDKPQQSGEDQKESSPERRGQSNPPESQDRGCRPRCVFYWPSPLFRSRRTSSTLVFITSVTNDSMSVQNRSDWSMRGTIVL